MNPTNELNNGVDITQYDIFVVSVIRGFDFEGHSTTIRLITSNFDKAVALAENIAKSTYLDSIEYGYSVIEGSMLEEDSATTHIKSFGFQCDE